jgi:hypothetical protein
MKYKSQLIAAVVALVIGFISAKSNLNQTWIALIPWAIIGILIIWMSPTRRQGMWNGAVYGAVLTDSFMLFNYKGGTPHLTFYVFIVALAAFGLIVGSVGGLIVWSIKQAAGRKT